MTDTKTPADKTFTQDDVNRLLANERRRIESKFADYDELKANAEKFSAHEQAAKSELQKLTERVEAAEARALEASRREFAATNGVPEKLVTGSDEAAWKAAVEAAIEWRDSALESQTPPPPSSEGQGKVGDPVNAGENSQLTLADLNSMSEAAIEEARAAGRFNDLLAGKSN